MLRVIGVSIGRKEVGEVDGEGESLPRREKTLAVLDDVAFNSNKKVDTAAFVDVVIVCRCG